jgi:hypothetical protein
LTLVVAEQVDPGAVGKSVHRPESIRDIDHLSGRP